MRVEWRGERVKTGGRDRICFAVPAEARSRLWRMILAGAKKGADTWHVTVKPVYRRRTTGERSQNHHAWGHAGQIAAEVGETREKIMHDAKERAVSMGYPTYTDWQGNLEPISETEATTDQYAHVIEALHQIAAFLGITLEETDD